MNERERAALRLRFGFRCGYCGVSEDEAGCIHTTDHFQPRSRGGLDDHSNWVYCCRACNEFKGTYWNPGSPQRILRPLVDTITDHIAFSEDGRANGLTETGQFHIEQLNLNRDALVAHRNKLRQLQGLEQRNAELIDKLSTAETRISKLSDRLARMKRQI